MGHMTVSNNLKSNFQVSFANNKSCGHFIYFKCMKVNEMYIDIKLMTPLSFGKNIRQ